ncbi:MalY/PatB family protein [Salinibacterium hongtaonis]|uniref:cysteine-S-conjugate beta-lyase n=1 Tax=Homoserinimonas hongtaonis TaxID=2079791 RepID=A0A2U1SZ71_9MICO|nr:aminotransferase class I/II-fold pyridoxal phosphate-dependent enzyme [Salinibacterium hongtaonis]PWB96909.1 aspartate aminotransferase [Salinibacterium hongtaonis]
MPVHAEPLDTLRRRTSVKWRAYPDDVLPLFVAEMDFPLARPIGDAIRDAVDRSDTGYSSGGRELPHAFSSFAEKRWGWAVNPDHVRSTADVSMGILEVLRRVTQPGDSVVVTPPVYPPFYALIDEARTSVVRVPLLDDGASNALDLEGIDAAFAAGATAMVLCNPHNPLGYPHTPADLIALAEIAQRHDATIISDEIHAPLTHSDGHFTPFLTVSDAAREHGVSITSASKAWNLAGLKCALMITAAPRMHAVIDGMHDEVFWRTSHLGVQASIAAFREGESWLDDVISNLEANRRLLDDLLAESIPGSRYRQPVAGYLAWIDLRDAGWGDDPAAGILERAKVALTSGPAFGREGTGFARLNFGCSPEVLTEAIERIRAARLSDHD